MTTTNPPPSLPRLASLVTYAFATAANPCPCSDTVLAEIESAATAILAALSATSWGERDTDSLSDICCDAGNEIALTCESGLCLPRYADWGAFVAEWRNT